MIHVLEKHIADKIAAGEVIDRPVSIIKELLENSIDAGADQITVEIRNGGKSYIRVTDNGSGIEAGDMETAFLRHATSKISSVRDLDAIGTLGFRGEALASICAVARVELISKTADAKMGRRVVTEGSEILANEGIGCPEGTTVTVQDLFYNVPARQKFLSSDNGESRRIIDMVSRIALAYGDVRFTLINGKKQVFTTRGKGNIFDAIVSVYGSDTGRDLLPVERTSGDLIVKGFVSAPSASASSRSRQIFCVNGRVISSKVLEKALDEAYKEKLFHGRFPVAFLFLSIPPEKLDVNIHPTKKEIRFDDDFEVHDFLVKAVRQALEDRGNHCRRCAEKTFVRYGNRKLQSRLRRPIRQQTANLRTYVKGRRGLCRRIFCRRKRLCRWKNKDTNINRRPLKVLQKKAENFRQAAIRLT